MAVKNTLRIRFTFNRAGGGGPKTESVRLKSKTDRFATTVIYDVAVAVAKGKYNDLRAQVRSDLEPVLRRELRHIAQQYLQFIVGKQRIGGTITSLVKGSAYDAKGNLEAASSYSLKSALPPWKPLSPKYLARKKTKPNWFKYKGTIDSSNISGVSWEQMFGPVSIIVQPVKNNAIPSTIAYSQGAKEKLRVGVANIRASVFGLLTPSMVAALADGNLSKVNQSSDGRTSGLLDLVHAQNPGLSYRLGHNSKPGHVYRPSLEPFLAFAVTRSVPSALINKLKLDGYKVK